jgi:hypothetical protein
MTQIELQQIPTHVAWLTVIQTILCFAASIGIGLALTRREKIRTIAHHRIPLCFVGMGLFVTGAGFLTGVVEVVKLGHIATVLGISMWVWLMIVRQWLRNIGYLPRP